MDPLALAVPDPQQTRDRTSWPGPRRANRSRDIPVSFSQKRFLLNGAESSSEYLWWVPLTYTSQTTPDFNTTQPSAWMRKQRQMTLNGQWKVPSSLFTCSAEG